MRDACFIHTTDRSPRRGGAWSWIMRGLRLRRVPGASALSPGRQAGSGMTTAPAPALRRGLNEESPEMAEVGSQRGSAGFSLPEVLIALGVFAVGFVAVCALLPVGILLQRQTVDMIEGDTLEGNLRAMLSARQLTTAEMTYDNSGTTTPIPNDGDVYEVDPHPFGLTDRSYLANRPGPGPGPAGAKLSWRLLARDSARDAANPRWELYGVILLRRGNEDPVPSLTSVAVTVTAPSRFNFDNSTDLLKPGDVLIDAFGSTYRVASSNATGAVVTGLIIGRTPTPPPATIPPVPPLQYPAFIVTGSRDFNGVGGVDATEQRGENPLRGVVGPITDAVE